MSRNDPAGRMKRRLGRLPGISSQPRLTCFADIVSARTLLDVPSLENYMHPVMNQLSQLPVSERLELVQDLWAQPAAPTCAAPRANSRSSMRSTRSSPSARRAEPRARRPSGPLPDLLRIPASACHDSILSRNGASGKPGAVQSSYRADPFRNLGSVILQRRTRSHKLGK